jgi:hypothetical protein
VKIHQVVVTETPHYEVDPVLGVKRTTSKDMLPGSASVISAGDHGTFEVGSDGAFDVPNELGEEFLRMPGWFPGANPFVVEPAAKQAKAAKAA